MTSLFPNVAPVLFKLPNNVIVPYLEKYLTTDAPPVSPVPTNFAPTASLAVLDCIFVSQYHLPEDTPNVDPTLSS